ncbi:N/A [soil metagenome]
MTLPDPNLISLVIPVCNEVDSLPKLLAEIDMATKHLPQSIEVVFIDDGSTDGSWNIIATMAKQDPRVHGIRFRRNFGKAAALAAGFKQARGGIVFTLDADLQDDPKEIPRFLTALEDKDVISGWKKVRHDPWHKVFPSRVFNALVSRTTGVILHDHNCGFKGYRAEVLSEVRLYGERHRFIPVLAAARGYRVGELVIAHRAREFGHSKYGFRRFVKGFLDLITIRFLTDFSRRPKHFLGATALFMIFAGFALGVGGIIIDHFFRIGVVPIITVAVMSVGSILLGTQMMMAGLVAELIVDRTVETLPPYNVRETTDPT